MFPNKVIMENTMSYLGELNRSIFYSVGYIHQKLISGKISFPYNNQADIDHFNKQLLKAVHFMFKSEPFDFQRDVCKFRVSENAENYPERILYVEYEGMPIGMYIPDGNKVEFILSK